MRRGRLMRGGEMKVKRRGDERIYDAYEWPGEMRQAEWPGWLMEAYCRPHSVPGAIIRIHTLAAGDLIINSPREPSCQEMAQGERGGHKRMERRRMTIPLSTLSRLYWEASRSLRGGLDKPSLQTAMDFLTTQSVRPGHPLIGKRCCRVLSDLGLRNVHPLRPCGKEPA